MERIEIPEGYVDVQTQSGYLHLDPNQELIFVVHHDTVRAVEDHQHTEIEDHYNGTQKRDAKIVATRSVVLREVMFIVGTKEESALSKERQLRYDAEAETHAAIQARQQAEMEVKDRIAGLEVERDEIMAARDKYKDEVASTVEKLKLEQEEGKKVDKKLNDLEKEVEKVKKAIGELKWNEIVNGEDLPF